MALGHRLGPRQIAFRQVAQAQPAQRQRQPALKAACVDIHQFQAAAAEIAADPARIVKPRQDALGRVAGLVLARQDDDLAADRSFRRRDEIRPVLGLAGGGRRNGMNLAHIGLRGEPAKARQRGERTVDSLRVEPVGARQPLAETAEDLLVEEHRQRAAIAFVDDQANRVRPDIDDRDRLTVLQPSLRDRLNRTGNVLPAVLQ